MSAIAQTERLNFRLDAEKKHLIERAAASIGQTLTDFALSVLIRESQDVLRAESVLRLSDRDRDAFLKALDNPPAPNAALKRAAKAYRQYQRGRRNAR